MRLFNGWFVLLYVGNKKDSEIGLVSHRLNKQKARFWREKESRRNTVQRVRVFWTYLVDKPLFRVIGPVGCRELFRNGSLFSSYSFYWLRNNCFDLIHYHKRYLTYSGSKIYRGNLTIKIDSKTYVNNLVIGHNQMVGSVYRDGHFVCLFRRDGFPYLSSKFYTTYLVFSPFIYSSESMKGCTTMTQYFETSLKNPKP